MTILDQVGAKSSRALFSPKTVRHLFVLRLARKLGEPSAVTHYAELARYHSDETLLLAYRHTMNHGHPPRDLGRKFHEELASTKEQEPENHSDQLLAIKIERRSLAVGVFVGAKLDFHEVRHLSSQQERAEGTVLSFLGWVTENFQVDSVAMEKMSNGNEIRRSMLNRAVLKFLRDKAYPVWEVSKHELLEFYGHPPLQTRADVRQVAHTILWSMFNTQSPDAQEVDAAGVGLYVQIERLFL